MSTRIIKQLGLLCVLLSGFTSKTQCQTTFISLRTTGQFSKFQNATDKAAGSELEMKSPLKPAVGLFLGVRWSEKQKIAKELLLGLEYSSVGQNYKGAEGPNFAALDAESRLNYIKIPLLFRLSFSNRTFSPFLAAGVFYSHLINYKERFVFKNYTSNNILSENSYEFTNDDITFISNSGPLTGSIDRWIYNRTNLGPEVSGGLIVQLSDGISVNLGATASWGLLGIENRRLFKVKAVASNGNTSNFDVNIWDANPKYNHPPVSGRTDTKLFTLGISAQLNFDL